MKIRSEVKEGIGWIVLNQPERRNAIDTEMMEQMGVILSQLEMSDEVKLVAITGNGSKAFCSGGDLSVFHNLHTEQDAYPMLSKIGDILFRLFTFPKPTIALLNGTAVGGGCEIAVACDFRIAHEDAELGFIQGTLGITTGWGGSTFLMERILPGKAFEILLSARMYTAKEAHGIGLIEKVLDTDDFEGGLLEHVAPMLQRSSGVLQAYKRRRLDQIDLPRMKERIDREIQECSRLWESDEHHRAVRRFLDR